MEPYPYEMDENHELKLHLVLDKLREIEEPNKAVLILHTSAHNPTGVDPTKEQWKEIKKLCYMRGILPVFDCAYQVMETSKNTKSINIIDDISIPYNFYDMHGKSRSLL